MRANCFSFDFKKRSKDRPHGGHCARTHRCCEAQGFARAAIVHGRTSAAKHRDDEMNTSRMTRRHNAPLLKLYHQ